MIYPYKYLDNHRIEKLHNYLDYFFKKMFLECDSTFDKNILIEEDFKDIFDSYEKVSKPLKNIFSQYQKLPQASKEKILEAFTKNNMIEDICSNKIEPIPYFELDNAIKTELYDFYKSLWETVLGYKKVIDDGCSVTTHFKEFTDSIHQDILICPFCGLENLLSKGDAEDGKRDDYDHYLPKKLYPFNSINFKNLVPMCHRCNSKYKNQKNTVVDIEKNKRKVFYPYDASLVDNRIIIEIDTEEEELSDKNKWDIIINASLDYVEELNSWNDIFDIKQRYKNRIIQLERTWKEGILKKYRRQKARGDFNKEYFEEDILDDIEVLEQVNGIIQLAYYQYFLENIFPFMEETEEFQ
jgi:hypothetical protein